MTKTIVTAIKSLTPVQLDKLIVHAKKHRASLELPATDIERQKLLNLITRNPGQRKRELVKLGADKARFEVVRESLKASGDIFSVGVGRGCAWYNYRKYVQKNWSNGKRSAA